MTIPKVEFQFEPGELVELHDFALLHSVLMQKGQDHPLTTALVKVRQTLSGYIPAFHRKKIEAVTRAALKAYNGSDIGQTLVKMAADTIARDVTDHPFNL